MGSLCSIEKDVTEPSDVNTYYKCEKNTKRGVYDKCSRVTFINSVDTIPQ